MNGLIRANGNEELVSGKMTSWENEISGRHGSSIERPMEINNRSSKLVDKITDSRIDTESTEHKNKSVVTG